MHIIVDARMVDKHLHGIGRYTFEHIKGLCELNKVRVTVLVNNINDAKNTFNFDNLNYINIESRLFSVKEQIELPKILNKFSYDTIFHSPSIASSPFIKIKTIMTIHDLNHLKFPQFHSWYHKYYYNYIVKPCANRAEKIMTVSNFSKKEIMRWLKCDKSKIKVTYSGVDSKFSKVIDKSILDEVKEKYNLPNNFILYIGNLKPHKNVNKIIEAFSKLTENMFLIINGNVNEELKNIIDIYNVKTRVKFIGYVEDNDLPVLYSLAKVFVFPSLYEGFGLPVLEAMACECPVITSNISSLPEVVGDSALKINPYDSNELTNAINQVLNDEKLKKTMIEEGKEQSRKFQWKDVVNRTYEGFI